MKHFNFEGNRGHFIHTSQEQKHPINKRSHLRYETLSHLPSDKQFDRCICVRHAGEVVMVHKLRNRLQSMIKLPKKTAYPKCILKTAYNWSLVVAECKNMHKYYQLKIGCQVNMRIFLHYFQRELFERTNVTLERIRKQHTWTARTKLFDNLHYGKLVNYFY